MKKPPSWVSARCLVAGGINRFGAPNYRVVWSGDRMELVGGEWDDFTEAGLWHRTVNEYRSVPKYWTAPERWILEKWMAPEYYAVSKEEWLRVTNGELGEFPSTGDYEMALIFQTPDGKYLELTETIVERAVRLIEQNKAIGSQQRKDAILRREEKKQLDAQRESEDIFDDARRVFDGQPTSFPSHGNVVLTDAK